MSSVYKTGKAPPADGASAALPAWVDKRTPRTLLAGLLGYVGATAAGVGQHSHGADAWAGFAVLAGFCFCFLAIAIWPGRLYWLRAFWPLLGAMVALALTEMLFAQGDAFYLAAVIIVPTAASLGPPSRMSPSATPARFSAGWFWLIFHLPSNRAIGSSKPTIPFRRLRM